MNNDNELIEINNNNVFEILKFIKADLQSLQAKFDVIESILLKCKRSESPTFIKLIQ